jgi:hypothetical protein
MCMTYSDYVVRMLNTGVLYQSSPPASPPSPNNPPPSPPDCQMTGIRQFPTSRLWWRLSSTVENLDYYDDMRPHLRKLVGRTSGFTVAVWINYDWYDSQPSYARIFELGSREEQSVKLFFHNERKLRWFVKAAKDVSGKSESDTDSIEQGVWTHILITTNRTDDANQKGWVKIYKNFSEIVDKDDVYVPDLQPDGSRMYG